jgi:hypothetical protein
MGAELFEVRQDEGVLVAQHRTESKKSYARLAYSSVMAKTTSSSSFLHRVSINGSSVVLIPSTGMRVATMGTLWMVLILEAESSVSSSSLNNSKGLKFYIRSNYINNNGFNSKAKSFIHFEDHRLFSITQLPTQPFANLYVKRITGQGRKLWALRVSYRLDSFPQPEE